MVAGFFPIAVRLNLAAENLLLISSTYNNTIPADSPMQMQHLS
jgi:hypothetical protein